MTSYDPTRIRLATIAACVAALGLFLSSAARIEAFAERAPAAPEARSEASALAPNDHAPTPAAMPPSDAPAVEPLASAGPAEHERSLPPAPEPPEMTGLAPARDDPSRGDVSLGDSGEAGVILTIAAVNAASLAPPDRHSASAAVLKAQVLLDRAGFSPGAIDGRDNGNFRKALRAFQRHHGLDDAGALDRATWEALLATSDAPVLGEYAITRADMTGPFAPDLPDELEESALFKRLSYRNLRELLAERFHMDQRLLEALNPAAAFEREGNRVVVTQVARVAPKSKVARIEVDKPQRRLRAYDKDGRLVAAYPASIGSEDKPTPSGSYVVRRVARFPAWHYSPRFAFKEVRTTRPFRLAAGPNNPLGTVWIAINKPTYGIHGTPQPEEVGTSDSHGCVRLTNWDAQALAAMVTRGTRVEFLE